MAADQTNRILQITSPLGEEFLIESFTAEEGISQLFAINAELVHEEPEGGSKPTPVDPAKILGQAVIIKVTQPDLNQTSRYFHGVCNRIAQGGRDVKFSGYEITLVPHIWVLTKNSQSRIFQHMTVPDILKKIFDGFDVKYELQGTFHKRNYCVQYRETDFAFASRLMEEEGIFYYFVHSDSSHQMIVANTAGSHRDCPSKSTIEFVTELEDEESVSSIQQFGYEHNLQSGKVAYWDNNFQLTTNKLEAVQTTAFSVGGNDQLEIYDYPGGYARKYDGINSGGGEQAAELNHVFDDKANTAKISMEALDGRYKTIFGSGTCASMVAGHRFDLKSHPVPDVNAKYVITSVRHTAGQSPSYRSEYPLEQPYSNTFTCIPFGAGMPVFRPLRTTPKPVVRGSQTAIVVGPAGEEIFTDKYGRVKVQFHWDRDGKNDADSSCWVRVRTDIAGKKWGTMYIPRIGQEVVVDFMEGDPDQPLIVGSVYNPETMPHYELPKFKTLTYIKTRTSPDDGKGFNELRFEDKANKEQVFIRSQKRMDVRVRGSLYETCGGSRNEVIGLKQENQPGGNLAVTVAGCYDLHVKESHFVGIDQKLNETVKGEVVEDYQASLATMVKTKAELNAMEIIMEAKTKISLKVGGNCIVIDPSGITIAGTMVKINSGGWGTETGNPSIDDPLDAEISDNGEPGNLDRPRTGGGRRGRNRRRLNSQHYIAPPRPGEDARITAMRNLLQDSAQGRHALEVYDRYGVQPSFRAGEGSTFNGTNNNMNINPAQTPERQALGFVHEMNHAQADHEGASADINNQTRGDYVDTQLNEETEGVIRSIEARQELIDAGHNNVTPTNYPLQNEYEQAYNQAVTDARAADPNLTDEQAAQIGREAGRQRVRDGFNNGEVQTSNTHQSYPDYYGDAWDRAHPAPTP